MLSALGTFSFNLFNNFISKIDYFSYFIEPNLKTLGSLAWNHTISEWQNEDWKSILFSQSITNLRTFLSFEKASKNLKGKFGSEYLDLFEQNFALLDKIKNNLNYILSKSNNTFTHENNRAAHFLINLNPEASLYIVSKLWVWSHPPKI